MTNPFIVNIQVSNQTLSSYLHQWVEDCADLETSNQIEAASLYLWDWATFLYQKQLGNSMPNGVVVFNETHDPVKEGQVLVSGAMDIISGPYHQANVCLRLSLHVQRLQHLFELESLSVTDPLTGLYNRRKFNHEVDVCWRQGLRQHLTCSILMIDVDHFKSFNDSYGHLAGDQCLRELSKVFRLEAVRPHDVVARVGGEEFSILLSDTPLLGAEHVAQRILRGVKELNILNEGTALGRVSISIGISSIMPKANDKVSDWIHRADDALYFAKESGRNQIKTEAAKEAAVLQAEIF